MIMDKSRYIITIVARRQMEYLTIRYFVIGLFRLIVLAIREVLDIIIKIQDITVAYVICFIISFFLPNNF